METLYTGKHLQYALSLGFMLGIGFSVLVGGKKSHPDFKNITQAGMIPVVPTAAPEPDLLPLQVRKTLWGVLDNIEDPVRKELVGRYTRSLVKQQRVDGFPTSVRLAQMILEAGFSESNPEGSELFQKGRNPFGIKYWRDGYPERIDNWLERVEGYVVIGNNKYMKFRSVEEAFAVHGDFVTKGHYAAYVDQNKIVPDYKEWVEALVVKPPKRLRYAEDPTYYRKIVKIIEDNGLQELDTLFLFI